MQSKIILEKNISYCKTQSLVSIFVKIFTLILFLAKTLRSGLAILIWKFGTVRLNMIKIMTLYCEGYFSFTLVLLLNQMYLNAFAKLSLGASDLIKSEKVKNKMLLQNFLSWWFRREGVFFVCLFLFLFSYFFIKFSLLFFKKNNEYNNNKFDQYLEIWFSVKMAGVF